MRTVFCTQCGHDFRAYPRALRRGGAMFCSRRCFLASGKHKHFGEDHGRAKVTPRKAHAIRTLRAVQGRSYRWLAAYFEVSRGTVWRIVTGKAWQ